MILGFRYALGRSTYVVADVVDLLERNWKAMDEYNRALIVREIGSAIDNGRAGMDIDVILWNRVLVLDDEFNNN